MQYRTQQFSFGPGHVTPAVKVLLITNTAVFVVQTFLTLVGKGLDNQLTLYFGLVPPLVLNDFYVWQLFTYQFLHGWIVSFAL